MNERLSVSLLRLAQHQVPLAVSLLLVLVGAVPLAVPHLAPVTPLYCFLAVFYWSVYRPDLLPPFHVFVVGVFQDLVGGTPLGMMTLALLLLHGFVVTQRTALVGKGFLVEWFALALVAGGTSVLTWVVVQAYFATLLSPLPVLTQALLTVAVYPVLAWVLSQANRRLAA